MIRANEAKDVLEVLRILIWCLNATYKHKQTVDDANCVVEQLCC